MCGIRLATKTLREIVSNLEPLHILSQRRCGHVFGGRLVDRHGARPEVVAFFGQVEIDYALIRVGGLRVELLEYVETLIAVEGDVHLAWVVESVLHLFVPGRIRLPASILEPRSPVGRAFLERLDHVLVVAIVTGVQLVERVVGVLFFDDDAVGQTRWWVKRNEYHDSRLRDSIRSVCA